MEAALSGWVQQIGVVVRDSVAGSTNSKARQWAKLGKSGGPRRSLSLAPTGGGGCPWEGAVGAHGPGWENFLSLTLLPGPSKLHLALSCSRGPRAQQGLCTTSPVCPSRALQSTMRSVGSWSPVLRLSETPVLVILVCGARPGWMSNLLRPQFQDLVLRESDQVPGTPQHFSRNFTLRRGIFV